MDLGKGMVGRQLGGGCISAVDTSVFASGA